MVFLLLTSLLSFVSIDIQVRKIRERSRVFGDRFLVTERKICRQL